MLLDTVLGYPRLYPYGVSRFAGRPTGYGLDMSENGETKPAGEGLSDQEMVEQVANQTDSEGKWADVFERERDGASSETEAAKADADELEG